MSKRRTTITWKQVHAIWDAINEWQYIAKTHNPEFYGYLNDGPPNLADMRKSALLGRMLIEGRDPLPEPPEKIILGAPAYELYDPELCPTCGGEREGPGGQLGSSIATEHIPSILVAPPYEHRNIQKIGARYHCIERWHIEWKKKQRDG